MPAALTEAGFACDDLSGPDSPGEPEPLRLDSFNCEADQGDGITIYVSLYGSPEDAESTIYTFTTADGCADGWSDTNTLVSDTVVMTSEALDELGFSAEDVASVYDAAFAAIGFDGPLTCNSAP